MAKSLAQEFTKGLWDEVAPFRLVLGLCPILAVTKSLENGVGMGLATTFVLVWSNVLVSLLRSVIPSKVRIACFIVIIATFVTVVELLMQAFTYPLFLKLGIFIPLIVVNCIVLGRAEAFASKNGVVKSFADGLGIGIGYTLSLAALSAIREIFGTGTLSLPFLYNIQVMGASFKPFTFMVQAPGAFICLGLMLCMMNLVPKKIMNYR
jgi:electron transport complex protein RnfE